MEGIVYTVIFSTPTFPSKIFGEIPFHPKLYIRKYPKFKAKSNIDLSYW
jgi:hypothetical protein